MHPDTQKVLEWCNSIRAKHGIIPMNDMPHGIQMDEHNCPIALSFTWSTDGKCNDAQAEVGAEHYSIENHYEDKVIDEGDLPFFIRQWISDFDEGKYQEYVMNYEDDGCD
jgi:hypothetical protein